MDKTVADFAINADEAASAYAWWTNKLHDLVKDDINEYIRVLGWDSFEVLKQYREDKNVRRSIMVLLSG